MTYGRIALKYGRDGPGTEYYLNRRGMAAAMAEKVIFTGDEGEELPLYVVEKTRLGGVDYILAADTETGDGSCFILRDISGDSDETAVYEMVEDDDELDNLLSVFAELLDDLDLEF